MSKNYRLYTFINFYLSQIQQGIQTAHIVHELFNKYPNIAGAGAKLRDWSHDHKTIIVLNGGEGRAINEMLEVTKPFAAKMDLPYAEFFEDEGLGNIRTGFGIVLQEEIYNAQYEKNDEHNGNFSFTSYDEDDVPIGYVLYPRGTEEFNFLELLKQKRLA